MRNLAFLFVSTGLLMAAVRANGQEVSQTSATSENDAPCVEVEIGQDRASHINCLNETLRRRVEREKNAPLVQAPIDAHSPSNKVGTANVAAAQQMMGNAFGVSAIPQRPHPTFASPLVAAPR